MKCTDLIEITVINIQGMDYSVNMLYYIRGYDTILLLFGVITA